MRAAVGKMRRVLVTVIYIFEPVTLCGLFKSSKKLNLVYKEAWKLDVY